MGLLKEIYYSNFHMKENGWKRTVRTVFRNYQNIYLPNVNLVRNKHILILSSQSPSPPVPRPTKHPRPTKSKQDQEHDHPI